MTPISVKRKAIMSHLDEILTILDPSGSNTQRYRDQLTAMNDTEFSTFMEHLRKGDTQIHIYMPNGKLLLKQANILKAAREAGVQLFEKLWFVDKVTGKKYLTPNKYLVLQLPIRRVSQFLLHKMAVPKSDKHIDKLTGQVAQEDAASAISQVEIQALFARDLKSTLLELVKVRGGDVNAYANFKQQLEETGSASINALEPNTTARSVVIAGVLLKAMLLDNNLYEGLN